MRDHQRRPPGFHEGGLDELRVVATARFGIGLTDDDKVAVAGVARQQTRQSVERTALLEDAEARAAALRVIGHAGEDPIRCHVRKGEVLVDDVGRSMPASAAHEGLGDKIERGDPGAERLWADASARQKRATDRHGSVGEPRQFDSRTPALAG